VCGLHKRTRLPTLSSQSLTFGSLHALVSSWYLCRLTTALSLSGSNVFSLAQACWDLRCYVEDSMFYLFGQYCICFIHQSKWCEVCRSRHCCVVASYYSWHDLGPFAFPLAFEYLLDCFKYQGVGSFDRAIGLGMLYGCEGHLHFDLLTKVLEHCIVDYNLAWDAVVTDDVLPEKLFDSCGAYVCDRPRLNPLCEVLRSHNSEGVISLYWC
jgi:hypothetical protein